MASSTTTKSGEAKMALEHIAYFWPDLPIPKDAFSNPEFIVRLYSCFVSEINERITDFINEEITVDEFDDIQDFNTTVVVFLKVSKLLKKINQNSLNLIDFYMPNAKKMCPLATVAVHFVMYVNNSVEHCSDIINRLLQRVKNSQELRTQQQKLLEESATISEGLARCIDEGARLKKILREARKAHEKIVEERKQKDLKLDEERSSIKVVYKEVDQLEDELKILEDTEADLKESILTDEEYHARKNKEAFLENELQQLDAKLKSSDLDRTVELVHQYEKTAEYISTLDLEALAASVTNSHGIKQEAKSQLGIFKVLTDQLKSLKRTASLYQKKMEDLEEVLKDKERLAEKIKLEMGEDATTEKMIHAAALAKAAKCFERHQRLETEILELEKQIQEIDENTKKAKELAAREYHKILSKDKAVAEKFHKVLADLKKKSEEAQAKVEDQAK